MPFRISSASEVFQKNNEAMSEGISGIHIVAYDIITAASTVKEHDHILRMIMITSYILGLYSSFIAPSIRDL